MNLTLITLQGIKIDKKIYELIIPTAAGEIAVFPGHEPLVAVAKPGAITIRHDKSDGDDKLEYLAISGGIIEVSQRAVRVLVDAAIYGEDIVEAESQAALERAVELRDSTTDQLELEKAHQMVDRHSVRLKVAELHRRRRNL